MQKATETIAMNIRGRPNISSDSKIGCQETTKISNEPELTMNDPNTITIPKFRLQSIISSHNSSPTLF